MTFKKVYEKRWVAAHNGTHLSNVFNFSENVLFFRSDLTVMTHYLVTMTGCQRAGREAEAGK